MSKNLLVNIHLQDCHKDNCRLPKNYIQTNGKMGYQLFSLKILKYMLCETAERGP